MSVMGGRSLNPCVGRCSHNVGDDICRGCGRSVKQVLEWNSYDTNTKQVIMKELKESRMTSKAVNIQLNESGAIQELWVAAANGHTESTGNFDFASRVKDNILAFFNIGGRLGVMSVISTSDDPTESLDDILQAYGQHMREPVTLLEHVVLLDYELHQSPDERIATIYMWEPGSPTEPETRRELIVIKRETDTEPRMANATVELNELPLDTTVLDFLKHTKLL